MPPRYDPALDSEPVLTPEEREAMIMQLTRRVDDLLSEPVPNREAINDAKHDLQSFKGDWTFMCGLFCIIACCFAK